HDLLTLEISQGNGIVTCFDVNGHIVLKQAVETGTNALEVSSLKPGVYLVQYAGTTWKFIKL
ncbi:MAG: T9SS type A sorting domain-containing protein, partial [Flavobacteriales bacterium]